MSRRGFLKRDVKAGWPDLAACMARAAHSSGVPFAELARAAQAARTALAECGRSTWTGEGSPNDWNDPRNWLYNRLPRKGDSVLFTSCSGAYTLAETLDYGEMNLELGNLTIADDFKGTIGKKGKRL